MKKRLLKASLGILIFFCKPLGAQSYVPFPDSNAVWNEFAYDENNIYTIRGDSIYNGHNYKKYFVSNDTTGVTTPTLVSLVRQDIPNRKVLRIRAGLLSEELLYKFGMNINDTVNAYTSIPGFIMNLKVVGKDSILINGQYRKRLQLMENSPSLGYYPGYDYWIEGIGSMFGVFNTEYIADHSSDIERPRLICFTKNGVKEISSSFFSRCFVHLSGVGIKKNRIQNSKLIVYPNPSNGSITIELNAAIKKPFYILLTDALGRAVKQLSLSANTKIDVSDLENGIYFISVSNEQKQILYQSKIVKQE